jgi:uncharacterized membrane protein
MAEQSKPKYIKYTQEQLAAVPTPAQKEESGNASSVTTSIGIGAGIGAVAGRLLGIDPVTGAVIGGSAGAIKGAKDVK